MWNITRSLVKIKQEVEERSYFYSYTHSLFYLTSENDEFTSCATSVRVYTLLMKLISMFTEIET